MRRSGLFQCVDTLWPLKNNILHINNCYFGGLWHRSFIMDCRDHARWWLWADTFAAQIVSRIIFYHDRRRLTIWGGSPRVPLVYYKAAEALYDFTLHLACRRGEVTRGRSWSLTWCLSGSITTYDWALKTDPSCMSFCLIAFREDHFIHILALKLHASCLNHLLWPNVLTVIIALPLRNMCCVHFSEELNFARSLLISLDQLQVLPCPRNILLSNRLCLALQWAILGKLVRQRCQVLFCALTSLNYLSDNLFLLCEPEKVQSASHVKKVCQKSD